MVKESKFKQYLLTTIVLLVLLSSVAYASLTPNVHAAELTPQQKGLSFLSNIVGLDLSKYTVNSKVYTPSVPASYLGVVPQENIGYFLTSGVTILNDTSARSGLNLTSERSSLNVLCTFANGNLQMLQVLDNIGSPILAKPETASAAGMAKNILTNYQAYTAGSDYGQLKATLDNVDAGKNVTQTSGNAKLEVTAIKGYTTFKWTYASNGIAAPAKFVSLGFKNSSLSYFVDNWQLYKIDNTRVPLSENSAKAITLDTAKTYNWSLKLDTDAFDAKKFNESNVRWTALVFDSSVGIGVSKTRNDDPSVLYPVWRVGVALDKWYGNLYGIQVDIWADTGEVRTVQEAWSSITPEEESALAKSSTARALPSPVSNSTTNSTLTGKMFIGGFSEQGTSSAMRVAFSTVAAVSTMGIILVWVVRQKKPQSCELQKLRLRLKISGGTKRGHFDNLLKRHTPSVGGILLCILLISSAALLFVSIPTVKATPTAGAVIWGSESYGSYDPTLPPPTGPSSWRKSNAEVGDQRIVAPMIANWFSQSGYSPSWNHQGALSTKTQILTDLQNLQAYDRVAVVDFDHGIGQFPNYYPYPTNEWHYQFEDYTGTITGYYNDPYHPREYHPENGVYDNDIYGRVASGKVVFAFINTCLSANISDQDTAHDPPFGQGFWPPQQYPPIVQRAFGMPFAWTRGREVKPINTQGFNIDTMMSDDGYAQPDWGPQVYIGFPWGSASLSQKIPFYTGTEDQWYFYWVERFFSAALNNQYPETVNQALDTASIQTWGTPFAVSYLRTGFDAYWWMYGQPDQPWPSSTLAVYGNGNIYLRGYAGGWTDNFNDNSMDTSKWQALQAGGATVNEVNSRLQVTVPYGSGWAQAGYVTANAIDMHSSQASIEVAQNSYVGQMTLQMGITKTTSSDPASENNWYRIIKGRDCWGTNVIVVEKKINWVWSQTVNLPWASPTGQLTISVDQNGIIQFFENGVLRYSEPFALPSYNLYTYVYTSSNKANNVGTDAFDNFALSTGVGPPPPNSAPTTPSVSGPTSGYVNTAYSFSAVSTDPDGDNIQYVFNWGDGTFQTTTGWFNSGVAAYASHSWSSAGSFGVTVKAQDVYGHWSSWSNPYTVNIQNPNLYSVEVIAWATDGYDWYSVSVNVWIDSTYVGTSWNWFSVTAGTHYIQTDDFVDGGYYYLYLDSIYPNPVTVPPGTTVTAYYWLYWA